MDEIKATIKNGKCKLTINGNEFIIKSKDRDFLCDIEAFVKSLKFYSKGIVACTRMANYLETDFDYHKSEKYLMETAIMAQDALSGSGIKVTQKQPKIVIK